MLISVQALRALAAWMVVGHHFMQLFFEFEAHNALEYVFADKGGIGVDVFFVISGLVIFLATADKALTPWRFMLMRVARIAPAYWFYTLLMVVVVMAAPSMFPEVQLELSHVLMSMLFIPAQHPGGYGIYPLLDVGWTLNFEMLFYLLFAFTVLLRQDCRLWAVATLLYLVCYLIGPTFDLAGGFYHDDIVFEFLMGIVIGDVVSPWPVSVQAVVAVAGNWGCAGGNCSRSGCAPSAGVGRAQCSVGHQLRGAGAVLPGLPCLEAARRLLLFSVLDPRIRTGRRAMGCPAHGNGPLCGPDHLHCIDRIGRLWQLPVAGKGYLSGAQVLAGR